MAYRRAGATRYSCQRTPLVASRIGTEDRMAAFIIANIEVIDPVAYEEYRRRVPPIITAHGGRYLARGGATTLLEGESITHRLVVLEFPDMANLRGFYESPEYRPLIAIRQDAARSSLLAVEGV